MRGGESSAGFTLIETLVALVIFVAGYLLIYQSVSLGWRGAMVAQTERAALRLARARLAVAGVEARLAEGQQWGQTPDGYRWTMQARPYSQPGVDSGPVPLAGFWVTIQVSWLEGALRHTRSVQLVTLKLAAQP
jgi:prepilin-type N-terminal cleavage/methylation domain-containing protein